MKIQYTNDVMRVLFRDIKQGTLFRDENNQGLFLKIKPINHPACSHVTTAVVIDPLQGGVSAGELTGWGDSESVVPVRSIEITVVDEHEELDP